MSRRKARGMPWWLVGLLVVPIIVIIVIVIPHNGTPGSDYRVIGHQNLAPGVEIEFRAPGVLAEEGSVSAYPDVSARFVTTGPEVAGLDALGNNPIAGVVDLMPDGLTFETPIRVALTWPDGLLDPADASSMQLYYLDQQTRHWMPVLVTDLDVANREIVADLSHFSEHAPAVPDVSVTSLTVERPILAGQDVPFRFEAHRLGGSSGTAPLQAFLCPVEDVWDHCPAHGDERGLRSSSCVDVCTRVDTARGTFTCTPSAPGLFELVLILGGDSTRDYALRVWSQFLFAGSSNDEPLAAEFEQAARRYAPVLRLSEGEQYYPTAVEELFGPNTEIGVEVPGTGRVRTIGATAINDFLATHGHSQAIIRYDDSHDGLYERRSQLVTPTVYWQVAQEGGLAILTYSMFYPFDNKSSRLRLGVHTFDRESISLVLERRGQGYEPIEVVYAGHIAGQNIYRVDDDDTILAGWDTGALRVEWREAQRDGDHPIAYVALGSHALYPASGRYIVDPHLLGHNALQGSGEVASIEVRSLWEPADGLGETLSSYQLTAFPIPANIDSRSPYRALLYFSGYWVDGIENSRFPPFDSRSADPIGWYGCLPETPGQWDEAVDDDRLAVPIVASLNPVRVLLVMDRSGSMGETDHGIVPIEEARRAISLLVDQLTDDDELGIIIFNDSGSILRRLTPLRGQRTDVLSAVLSIVADGGTDFGAALETAVTMIQSSGSEAPIILFLSDGKEDEQRWEVQIDILRSLGVVLHSIPIGADADEVVLCAMAQQLSGDCIRADIEGLTAQLGRLNTEARGLNTVASVDDVIRPGEVQSLVLDLIDTLIEHAIIECGIAWTGSDLALVARSPSGAAYSTDDPTSSGHAMGGADQAYRLLRIPHEPGQWTFETQGRDVPPEGELYTLNVTVSSEQSVAMAPLHDRYDGGEPVEIVINGCRDRGTVARLHNAGATAQTVELEPTGAGTCVGLINAPSETGIYPVSIEVSDAPASTLYATVQVGRNVEVVAQRDQWRRSDQPWAVSASGQSTLVILVLFGGVLLTLLIVVGVRSGRDRVRQAAGAGGAQAAAGGRMGRRRGRRLSVTLPDGESAQIPLRGKRIRIGRAPDNDVVIDDSHVSRYHLRLIASGSTIQIENLTEPSATRINGEPVATDDVLRWEPGQAVRLAGGIVLLWENRTCG